VILPRHVLNGPSVDYLTDYSEHQRDNTGRSTEPVRITGRRLGSRFPSVAWPWPIDQHCPLCEDCIHS
jgi:hypothetical protein